MEIEFNIKIIRIKYFSQNITFKYISVAQKLAQTLNIMYYFQHITQCNY